VEKKNKTQVVHLENGRGLVVQIGTFGATLMSVKLNGVELTVRIDKDRLPCSSYAGATIGRVANRIADAKFKIGDKFYEVEKNEKGINMLHGGTNGFHRQRWSISQIITTTDEIGVVLRYISNDGEQGFPGKLLVEAKFCISMNSNALRIVYTAHLDQFTKEPTIVNMCNHVYWNLSGKEQSTIRNHTLRTVCNQYIPVDTSTIPTGDILQVTGTPFDFTKEQPLGNHMDEIQGYDHCLCRSHHAEDSPSFIAELIDLESHRRMTIETTEPGMQVYTGNFLPGAYKHSAVALETEQFPDGINRFESNPGFQSTILEPGDKKKYRSETIFTFT